MARLKKDNEEVEDLKKLKPEDFLLRWVNFHLKNADSNGMQVSNLHSEMASGIVPYYSILYIFIKKMLFISNLLMQ